MEFDVRAMYVDFGLAWFGSWGYVASFIWLPIALLRVYRGRGTGRRLSKGERVILCGTAGTARRCVGARAPYAAAVCDSEHPGAVVLITAGPPNKRMQLTKLRAAPVRQAEVPPCAPAGAMDGGTASQLIRGVRQT